MFMSVLVLVVSAALFLFYVQTICERALRQEFSHAYFKQILEALQLEYPLLRDSIASNTPVDFPGMMLALKCDFFTLRYLLKNSDPARPGVRGQRFLVLYFRFLLLLLPLRHALNFREREAVLKLSTILEYFANVVGERVSEASLAGVQAGIR